jgi:hypothetical protein
MQSKKSCRGSCDHLASQVGRSGAAVEAGQGDEQAGPEGPYRFVAAVQRVTSS